ncbi:hypothetical protein [Acidovorax sp.]|uniref:hypothetical protein n=1 Tax=Acidovorax sp. TaxID=1872122 RepID=UPI002621DE1F|nr:hypothetical protein [Acidovorax sp.]
MSPDQLVTLASLVHSGSIGVPCYIAWCDELIREESAPPAWVLELSIERTPRKAAEILLAQANYVMSERWYILETSHLASAYEFLRYRSHRMSWEDFLRTAIRISHTKYSVWPTSDFERFLEAYVENEFASSVEYAQAKHLEQVLDEELHELACLDAAFPLEPLRKIEAGMDAAT